MVKDTMLDDLLGNEIKSALDSLEQIRKRLLKHYYISCFICIFVASIVYLIVNNIPYFSIRLVLIPIGFLSIAGPLVLIEPEQKKYQRKFQERVISRIIRHVHPDLHYYPDSYLTEEYFLESKLYDKEAGYYCGSNYISGNIGKTFVEFSEISAMEKHQKISLFNKGEYEYETIFNGIFLALDFNKVFNGYTIVFPVSIDDDPLFRIKNFFRKLSSKGEHVTLEDIEFNELFTVFANDQVEARYILTPSLMKRIKEFYKNTGCDLRMSFVNSKVYVTIPSQYKILTPKLFNPINDYSEIQKYFNTILLIIRIVEELNLNNRIWTK